MSCHFASPWRAASAVAILAAVFLFAAPGGAPAHAQAPPYYAFGEIVVTGETPRVVERATTADVITADDIARAQARTLDEALALLPGLSLRRGATGITLIDVRGLRTRNVLLLLDGVPLNSSFDGLFDPKSLSLDAVAQIKFSRGASSVLYGPAGNAGVINIITRAASDTAQGTVRLEGGTSDATSVRGQASFRRGALGVVASGAFFDQDHFDLSDDFAATALEEGGERLNSDREDRSALVSLTYDAPAGPQLGLNVSVRSGERGTPPATEDARVSDFAPRLRFERAESDALSVHAGLAMDLGETVSLRPTLFFNQTDSLINGFDDARFMQQAAVGSLREDATARIVGAALQLAVQPTLNRLWTFGLDHRREDWNADGFTVLNVDGGGNGDGGGGAGGGGGGGGGAGGGAGGGGAGGGGGGAGNAAAVPFDDEQDVRLTSLAAEHEWSSTGPFSAVVGAGFATQQRPGTDDEDGASFLVGGTYAWREGTLLRGSVARQIRFPTLRDLYDTDRGNPNLTAERVLQYEVGVEHALPAAGGHVALVLFRMDADDFIEGTPGEPLSNTAKVQRQGVELSGRHPWAEARFSWSYTYLDAKNQSPGADVEAIQNQPQHTVNLALDHETGFGLRLRGDVRFVADNLALSRTRPTRVLALDDYVVLGFGATQSLRADRLRLVARLENALDEDYVTSIGFPSPGRTLFLGLELRTGGSPP